MLREYLLRGHTVDYRFERIEQKIDGVIDRVDRIQEEVDFFVRTALPPVEGVFFEGQIFDAYEFVVRLVRSARERVVLVDNYVDETVLGLLAKREEGVEGRIYTGKFDEAFQADVVKHNEQYPPVIVEKSVGVHDRFLIIDDDVYHLGASVKDLGKKLFAFSRLRIPAKVILEACIA